MKPNEHSRFTNKRTGRPDLPVGKSKNTDQNSVEPKSNTTGDPVMDILQALITKLDSQ